jgi:hypothetical protein
MHTYHTYHTYHIHTPYILYITCIHTILTIHTIYTHHTYYTLHAYIPYTSLIPYIPFTYISYIPFTHTIHSIPFPEPLHTVHTQSQRNFTHAHIKLRPSCWGKYSHPVCSHVHFYSVLLFWFSLPSVIQSFILHPQRIYKFCIDFMFSYQFHIWETTGSFDDYLV